MTPYEQLLAIAKRMYDQHRKYCHTSHLVIEAKEVIEAAERDLRGEEKACPMKTP